MSSRTRSFVARWYGYFARMTGRATPFGLFAGCSVGRMGSVSRLRTLPLAQWRSFTTLDVGFLYAVTELLKHAEAADPGLCVRTNPTIYRAGGRLRYVEVRTEPGTLLRSYRLSAITATDPIDAILQLATGGATLGQLAAQVENFATGISGDEARAFIDDLLESQLLLGGIELGVTGVEPLADVIARLGSLRAPAAGHVRDVLAGTKLALHGLDSSGLGHAPSPYQDLLPALQTINPDFDPGRCFQANLYKPAPEATLNQQMTAAIADAVRLLHRITPYSGLEPLNRFRETFADRYGARETPLLEALDEDFGIGYDCDELSSAEFRVAARSCNGGRRGDSCLDWAR